MRRSPEVIEDMIIIAKGLQKTCLGDPKISWLPREPDHGDLICVGHGLWMGLSSDKSGLVAVYSRQGSESFWLVTWSDRHLKGH